MIAFETTVGGIAAEFPAAIAVFERHHIDYCCGGNRTFAEACRDRGLAPELVAAEIEAAHRTTPMPAEDWTQASLGKLLHHILEAHHAYLRAELPALEQRLAKTLEAHAAAHGDMLGQLQQTFLALSEEIYGHLHKEERILFPFIREMEAAQLEGRTPPQAPFGALENPIRVMRREHDGAAAALLQMRRITRDYTLPPDACPTFEALYRGLEGLEADLHRHIHLENNILFPRAIQAESDRAPTIL